MTTGNPAAPPAARAWLVAGLVATLLVAVADLATGSDVVLAGALIIGPVIAAFGAPARQVAALGVLSVALAIALGVPNDDFGEAQHLVRAGVIVVAVAGATLLARMREERDEELARVRPQARDAERLRFALDAGEMGTWHWDVATGRVDWDERMEALFGLAPGTFDGTFETYKSFLHPDDRDRALEAVWRGLETGTPWRFDHRVVWRDGSVHWLEGRGEPERNEKGEIIGGTGVTINIDARREAESRRTELLEAERRAREASEETNAVLQRLGQLTLALSRGATFDDIGRTIVRHGMDVLGAEFGWFGTVDASTSTLVARAHEGYREEVISRYSAVPLDMPLPITEALQSGEALFVESPEDRRIRYPQFRDGQAHTAFVAMPINAVEDVAAAVVTYGFRDRRKFSEEERRYMKLVAETCAQALERVVLYELTQINRARLRTTLDISEQIARLDDPCAVLETAARFSATRIGRFAVVYTMEPDGTIARAVTVHSDPEKQATLEAVLARGIEPLEAVRKVAETQLGEHIASLGDDPKRCAEDPDVARLGIVSLMAVPMALAGRSRGVIVIGDDRPLALGTPELELASDIGRRSASAYERAELWQQQSEQLQIEHRLVQLLQQSIVPEEVPVVPSTELAAAYRPADKTVDVGGDWYDAFAVEHCPLVLVVGDVAGHGVDAASLMGRVRNGIRAYAVENADPGALLKRADEMLRTLDPDAMVTAVIGAYDPDARVLTWARAGHPPPLVCYADGHTEFLETVNATPLGTVGRTFASAQISLPRGAMVVLYTDGLIERRHHSLDEGLEWLAQRARSLRDEPVEHVCEVLSSESFTPDPSEDDLCVLVLRTT